MPHPISQRLRPLMDAERRELTGISHACSEQLNRHQRAIALLAVAAGQSLTDAATAAGWKAQKTVTRLLRRFHERGLAALDDLPRSGHPRRYGPSERARILQELQTQEKTAVIERAYVIGERLGFQVWCEDEAGPYQTIPQAGSSWQIENRPACQAHQYLPGETAKLLTLFRPATGELRAQAVQQSTTAILHPWQKLELTAIVKQCPPAPDTVPLGRRWQAWDIYPAADQLDRFFPPVRSLLIWDNLAGHKSHSLVQGCAEHGILLLSTPNAGSWLNMAESVQRIIKRRALQGYHTYDVEILKQWLTDAVTGWNRHPTPFIWGGKRHARRDRAYARRHRVGGSGATATHVIPRRIRSVHYYRRAA